MGEICPKTKSYPPLIKQKLISTPPHIMIILRLSADQYHVTISRVQVYSSSRSRVFWELTADLMVVFDWAHVRLTC